MLNATLLLIGALVLAVCLLAAAVTLTIVGHGESSEAWAAFTAVVGYIFGLHTPTPPPAA